MELSQAMEMHYWRRCCQRTREDSVRNVNIQNELEINIDIIETIEAKKIKLLQLQARNDR